MTRTIWCGQVAAPNATLSFALRRKSGESPSAPPITKIVLATDSSRQRPRCPAKAEFAADVVKSLAIALRQLPLRALLQPADRNHDEAHEACLQNALCLER